MQLTAVALLVAFSAGGIVVAMKETGICEIGVIGLGVMGRGLAANIVRNGFSVAGFDRGGVTADGMEKHGIVVHSSLKQLVAALASPCRIFLMVPAGEPVDRLIDQLTPLLSAGDIIIDCGNSHFRDTERRQEKLTGTKISLIGMGVSGGEKGVLSGPSLMPGGDRIAFEAIKPVLQKIAAVADQDNKPCVSYIGPGSAGHFVKMVHNGIEYAEMQLIGECYDFMRKGMGFSASQISEVLADWNKADEASFLIDVSRTVLAAIDPVTGQSLVDLIVDRAGQKGTGSWTSQCALELGVGVPTITAAVDVRIMSSRKSERMQAAKLWGDRQKRLSGDAQTLLNGLRSSLFAGRIIAFAQGINLLQLASREYAYNLDICNILSIWRAGCILRSPLLQILAGLLVNKEKNLLLIPEIEKILSPRTSRLRQIVSMAAQNAIPLAAMASTLAYIDSMTSASLPANLVQAQRDCFGAHGFERFDLPGILHGKWQD